MLHVILDDSSTHAPKQLPAWIRSLGLHFDVRIHWLPVQASWLDQIEIVFSVLQRKVLMPNDFAGPHHVERRILTFFAERNRTARPIHWSYTSKQLMDRADRRHRLAAPARSLQPVRLQFQSTVWTDLPAPSRTSLPVGIQRVHQYMFSLFQQGRLPPPRPH